MLLWKKHLDKTNAIKMDVRTLAKIRTPLQTGGCEYLRSYLPPTHEGCLASCGFSHFFRPAGPPQPQYSM